MLDIFNSWRPKTTLKKNLLAFLDEMEKNLETYYVMDQRQFITVGFTMIVWEQVKNLNFIKNQESIQIYAKALLDFNNAYAEQKSYEQWYTSDLKNKSPENAKKLHALKNGLNDRVRALEVIIIPAGQALEKELLNLGFITS
jgi:hypothetical protein